MSTEQKRSLRPLIMISITILLGTLLTVFLAQGLHEMGTGLAYYEELRAADIDPQGVEATQDYPELQSTATRRGTIFSILIVLGTSVPLTVLITTAIFFAAYADVPIWRLVVVILGLTALSAAAIALALPRIGSFGLVPGFVGGLGFWLLISGFTLFSTVRRRRSRKQAQ